MKSLFVARVRKALSAVGLSSVVRPLYHAARLDRYFERREERNFLKRFGKYDRFRPHLPGIDVQFWTEDVPSKEWFFPRYEGGKIHEENVTLELIDALQGTEVFVDVGANIGWFTCIASRCLPEGRVYAFEMDEYNLELLNRNARLNGCENVEVHHAAVADENGTVTYYRAHRSTAGGYMIAANGEKSEKREKVEVPSLTLDSFFEERGLVPGVIKIDVEGAEVMVLKGLVRTMSRHAPVLFVEIHPHPARALGVFPTDALDRLFSAGYELTEICNNRAHGGERRLTPVKPGAVLTENTMVVARKSRASTGL